MKREFWCAVCDAAIVDSTKPETGSFYTVFGHQKGESGKWDGDYHRVMFAVCCKCGCRHMPHPVMSKME